MKSSGRSLAGCRSTKPSPSSDGSRGKHAQTDFGLNPRARLQIPRVVASIAAMPSAGSGARGRPSGMRARILDEFGFDPRKVIGQLVSSALPQFSFNRTRTAVVRAMGVRIGARSLIMGPLDLTGEGASVGQLSIGEDTFVTGPLHIDLGASVRIGNWVRLGHHVVLLTRNHEIGPPHFRCGWTVAAPIEIGDGAWIASCVTILPGVSVGKGAVVASGAVVTGNVAAHTLVAGVPAKVVRELDHGAADERGERSAPSQVRTVTRG
jgi:maltose O-acetyltransferase